MRRHTEESEGERAGGGGADQDGDGLGVGAPDGVGVGAVRGEGVWGAVEAGEADLVVGGRPEVERSGADGEEEAAENAEEDHAVRVARVQRDRLRPPVRHVHRGGVGGERPLPRRWEVGVVWLGEMRCGAGRGERDLREGGRCGRCTPGFFFFFFFLFGFSLLFFSIVYFRNRIRSRDSKPLGFAADFPPCKTSRVS